MPELVRVQHRPDRHHDAVGDLERRHPHSPPTGVGERDPRLAVHERGPVGEAELGGLLAPADERLRDPLGADERHGDRRRLAAAVAVDDGVRRQEVDQPVGVALLPRHEEAARDLLALLAADVEPAPALVDVGVRARQDLAAVGRALVDDRRDLLVGVVEHLPQQEDGPLDRGELLEQVQEGQRERIGGLGVPR